MFRTIACALLAAGALVGCHSAPAPGVPPPAPPATPTPPAPAAAPPESGPPAVVIDGQGVRLGRNAPLLVPMPSDPSRGADARFKRNGPNDLYLVPLADAFAREHLTGSIRVIFDPETPFRLVIEVLFTAAQSGIGSFDLVEAGAAARTVHFAPPRLPAARDPGEPQLNLTALIVHDGIGLKATGGNVAPGCNGVGPGLTLPRRNGALDLAGLLGCAKKLKAASPAFANERALVVTGNADTPFREIMDVAITARELLPDLQLAVPH